MSVCCWCCVLNKSKVGARPKRKIKLDPTCGGEGEKMNNLQEVNRRRRRKKILFLFSDQTERKSECWLWMCIWSWRNKKLLFAQSRLKCDLILMLTFCCSTATIQFVENHRKKNKTVSRANSIAAWSLGSEPRRSSYFSAVISSTHFGAIATATRANKSRDLSLAFHFSHCSGFLAAGDLFPQMPARERAGSTHMENSFLVFYFISWLSL